MKMITIPKNKFPNIGDNLSGKPIIDIRKIKGVSYFSVCKQDGEEGNYRINIDEYKRTGRINYIKTDDY